MNQLFPPMEFYLLLVARLPIPLSSLKQLDGNGPFFFKILKNLLYVWMETQLLSFNLLRALIAHSSSVLLHSISNCNLMCLIMCLLMHLIMQVYTFRASFLKCRLSTSLYRPINEISRSLDKICIP